MENTLEAYNQTIYQVNQVIKMFKIYPKVLHAKEHHYLYPFFNKGLFNILHTLDLVIGLKHLDVAQYEGRQLEANYFARILALTAYETLNHPNKLAGKQIRNFALEKLGKEGLAEMEGIMKAINNIGKENFSLLIQIRNNVMGHKHEDGLEQAELMLSIDHKLIYRICNDLFSLHNKLTHCYVKLITTL
jgi:hypothetical protein